MKDLIEKFKADADAEAEATETEATEATKTVKPGSFVKNTILYPYPNVMVVKHEYLMKNIDKLPKYGDKRQFGWKYIGSSRTIDKLKEDLYSVVYYNIYLKLGDNISIPTYFKKD